MANLKGKFILKLLLTITMLIQSVTLSYAMASMDLSHLASSSAHNHNGGHAMIDKMTGSHDQIAHEDDGVLENCCDTAACSPASVVNAVAVPFVPKSHYVVSTVSTLRSIDLPAEIKPPRSILG